MNVRFPPGPLCVIVAAAAIAVVIVLSQQTAPSRRAAVVGNQQPVPSPDHVPRASGSAGRDAPSSKSSGDTEDRGHIDAPGRFSDPSQPAHSVAAPAPAFAAFADWVHRFETAPSEEAKAALEAEGIPLAAARRTAMAQAIQEDPRGALARARELSRPARRRLPASVAALLEQPVNGRGDLEVIAFLPRAGDGRDPATTPIARYVVIDGERSHAFTFGRGLRFITKSGVPVNGYRLSSSAASPAPAVNGLEAAPSIVLLDESPARLLDPDEIAELSRAQSDEPICSTSGRKWTDQADATAVELAGNIHTFCGKVHASDWAAAGIAGAGLSVPGGANVPTAESSYTEGRKRMLLLRPIFADNTGTTMSTNEALSHWSSFSNYMFTISYGRLVFAPLGQGSDITPAMTLPGSVNDYNNAGLSKLYPTAREVARTNFGYDLAQYDFAYVCTKGAPAASYAGLAYVGGVGFHLANGYFGDGTASHEFGHNLGLNHANFWDTADDTIIGNGSSVEYGDGTDPLGGGGGLPQTYSARYRNYLGWIRDADIADLNALGSGRYRIYTFDLQDLPGAYRGAKFRRNGSQNYWVQFRQRFGDRSLQNGVQLLWTGNGNENSQLLDVRLRGGSGDNGLVIGRTFSDTNAGFHITPIGKGNTFPESIDIVVTSGNPANNAPPVAIVSASTLTPGAGALVTFSVSATDPTGDALAYFWECSDGDYSVNNSPAYARSFPSAGDYVVQCTVSDMKGGTARDSIVVRVGNPGTFRISGRVLDLRQRPVVGAKVSADASRFAYTDSDGRYTIGNLAAGSYSMKAQDAVSGAQAFAPANFNNPVSIGPDATARDFVAITSSLNVYTPLLAKGAAGWRYLDNGTDQGTAWRAPAFDHSSWSNGTAILGYGQANETTTLRYGPDANNKFITTYFRRAVSVPNPAAFTNFLLEVLRDDGVVVYLNGTEIYRNNMGPDPVTAASTAVDSVEPSSYLTTNLPASLFLAGNNVIAAEVHQVEPTSSDLNFDLALSGLYITNASGLNLVYIATPNDRASLPSGATVAIDAYVQSGGPAIARVDFYADSAKIGEAAAPPYSFNWTGASAGSHTLFVVAQIGSSAITSAPVVVTLSTPAPPATPVTLVAAGASWRYYATNAAPVGNWTQPSYNDSIWPAGPAELGYGDNDEATTISYGGNANAKWITAYFRHAFVVNDPAGITNLMLQLKRDDGAVVYLNGTELLRDNMPPGTPSWSTLATNAADDAQAFLPYPIAPALLAPGTNVFAVEVHQSTNSSSDLSFALSLTGLAATNRSRGCWLVSPADTATLSPSTDVTLIAEGVAGGTLGITRMEFFSDGLKLGEDVTAPYSFAWSNPPGGPHVLTSVAIDSEGNLIASEPIRVTVSAPPVATSLVSFGDVWKYLDDGSNAGTAWRSRVFDDRFWMSGPARLGYGGDGEVTTVRFGTNAAQKHVTTYFRRAFTVANPAVYESLLLRLIRDDAAVVYLNGNEVFRTNLQAGPVSWNSLALAAGDAASEVAPIDVILSRAGLLAGTNVLAVEIHQATVNSSDLGFDLALLALNTTNITVGIFLTSPANGGRYNAPASVPLTAFAMAPDGVALVEFFEGSNRIGQAAAHPFQATWAMSSPGTYTLTAVATLANESQLTSPPVTVTVSTPPLPIAPVLTTYIPAGASWRYWDSAQAPDVNWSSPAFSDAAWPSANARFGWGLDGERTTLTEGRVTHYFRRWFNAPNAGQLSELLFYLQRDDGAVVYLNGTEVFRSNMPPGPIGPGTVALASVSTPDETAWFEQSVATTGSGFLSGSNLVSVEIHQGSATSSDAGFDLALYGLGTTEPRVTLATPRFGVSQAVGLPIELEATAHAGSGRTVSRITFFADNTALGDIATAPYRLTWTGAGIGSHRLMARLTDNAGATIDSPPVTIEVTRELVDTTLIPSNSVWKYLDTGVAQPASWVNINFNDAAWASGPARLGFGGDGEATVINGGPASARYPTIYFRRAFVVPAGAVYTNLLFQVARDDGAVVYLNGTEMLRSGMPAGPITFTTLATGAVDEQTFFPTSVAVTNLPAGTNVVAVEVHQSSATSSDLGLNLVLSATGYLESSAPPSPSIVVSDGLVEITWPALNTGWRVYAAPAINAPSSAWAPYGPPAVVVSGRHVVTLAPAETQLFFRLGRP